MSDDLCNRKKEKEAPELLDSDLDSINPSSPTKLAQDVKRLKDVVFRQAAKRERLPLELFWSLFHSEIDTIKRNKEKERAIKKVFYGVDL